MHAETLPERLVDTSGKCEVFSSPESEQLSIRIYDIQPEFEARSLKTPVFITSGYASYR